MLAISDVFVIIIIAIILYDIYLYMSPPREKPGIMLYSASAPALVSGTK